MHDVGKGLFEEIDELRDALTDYRVGHRRCIVSGTRDGRCFRCKEADRLLGVEAGAKAIAMLEAGRREGRERDTQAVSSRPASEGTQP